MVELDKILVTIQQAIEIEKFGYEFYTNMRLFVKNKNGHRLISHLANLEIDHIKWLENEYKKQFKKIKIFDETGDLGISFEGKSEIFLKDKNVEIFKNFESKTAIKYAIEIEKRSMEFYRNHMESTDDLNLKDLFNKLADYEKDHISILNETLKGLEVENTWILPPMHIHW